MCIRDSHWGAASEHYRLPGPELGQGSLHWTSLALARSAPSSGLLHALLLPGLQQPLSDATEVAGR
eukprot:3625461-Heterocapsa_arctica.AAC.1